MIDLKETDKEFLLFIPAPQKNRARSIEGFRWNPNRRCWVYPKTPRVYDALLAEFRDEMAWLEVPRPSAPSIDSLADDYQRLAAENSRLRDELAALRARESTLVKAARSGTPDTALLDRMLAGRDTEIAALKTALTAAEERLRAQGNGAVSGGEHARAGRANAPVSDHQQFIAFFRALALETAGRDRDFKALLARLEAPDAFPRAARLALSTALRHRLGVSEGTMPLPDLVAMATLGGAITPRGADLAMAVERLGAEDTAGENASALWARCLLALYGAALVWPEIAGSKTAADVRMA